MAIDQSKCDGSKLRGRGFPDDIAQLRLLAQLGLVTETGCIEFTGYRNRKGYGRIRFRGKKNLAHRVAYILAYGEIPEGEIVRHDCDNPPCCNPEHLHTGTVAANWEDAKMRGRLRPRKGTQINTCRLTEQQVHDIRASRKGRHALAAQYRVSSQTIQNIRELKTWKHLALRITRTRVRDEH